MFLVIFGCSTLLNTLCEFGGEDFIVTEIHDVDKCCNG